MDTTSINDIFNSSMQLEQGRSIKVKCKNYSEMEVIRNHLYKNKRALTKQFPELANALYISRDSKNHTVTITKTPKISNIVFVENTGEETPYKIETDYKKSK